jgi:hypothetical protein
MVRTIKLDACMLRNLRALGTTKEALNIIEVKSRAEVVN